MVQTNLPTGRRPPVAAAAAAAVASLSDEQKKHLCYLWQTHGESPYLYSSSTSSNAMEDGTYQMVQRLHRFFVAGSEQQSSPRTLESLRRAFFPPAPGTHFQRLKSLIDIDRPKVICFDYQSFNDELDAYETKGAVQPGLGLSKKDDDANSFRVFLHERPHQALPALSCAVALALTTLYGCDEAATASSARNPFTLAAAATTSSSDQHPNANANANNRHQAVAGLQRQELLRSITQAEFVTRLSNVYPKIKMNDVKTSVSNHFLSLRGHVTKVRPKRLRVVASLVQCTKCGLEFDHVFQDGRYTLPTKCEGMKCRATRNFSLVRSTARFVDVQEIKLQEAQDETTGAEAGRQPRHILVELQGADLVDSCHAGDIVRVSGTVRAVNSAFAAGKTGKRAMETSTYQLYITANSIQLEALSSSSTPKDDSSSSGEYNAKRARQDVGGEGSAPDGTGSSSAISFGADRLQAIVQLSHADHRMFDLGTRMAFPFDLLVRSICPSIIGHDMVKAGILLALLGGTPPAVEVKAKKSNQFSIRTNSHVLIVGDPGMGKSQMLLAASQTAARSVYVGGNTSSTTGLTVSLTKEPGGEVGIEAGALVLSDEGVCCIDEFDKMAKQHQDGLLEAMEQQQISVAKAGVVASLPARCSIIAAANPKQGSYDMGKTVSENLNMAGPLLSRFDLVFILRDRADKKQDNLVASNIMKLYQDSTIDSSGVNNAAEVDLSTNGRVSMKNRLPWVANFQKQALPADLVRSYISYAHEFVKPVMSKEAAEVLEDHFLKLRQPQLHGDKTDFVPITTRQLEAMIRLSQARAKACLRPMVLKEDALDVIELMTQSVDEVHMDERGIRDRTRGGAGGTSNRKFKKLFEEEIRKFTGPYMTMDDLRRMGDRFDDVSEKQLKDTVDSFRNDGILLRNADGTYRLQ